jgi:hypothetical protein
VGHFLFDSGGTIVILIDPMTETVTETDFNGSIEDAYRVLGCELVDIVRLPHGNMLIVDDEGLLKPNRVFAIDGYHGMLAGKALLIGDNSKDFKEPPHVTLTEARDMVRWTNYITNN